MTRVSVVTPTYNRGERLQRAIDSVLNQTIADLEHFVVDDGSDEVDTEEIVATYDDDRITCLAHESNRGAAAARNTGLEAATGEYVAFLDSDDYWKPPKLERQIDELENGLASRIGVYCRTERERSNPITGFLSSVTTDAPMVSGRTTVLDRLVYPNSGFGFGSTLLVERHALEDAGPFDESFPRYEEIELAFRLLDIGGFGYVDEPLVVIGGSSYPSAAAVAESNRRLVEVLRERYSDGDVDIETAIASHNFVLARCYLRDGQFRDGLHWLRRGRPHSSSQYLGLLYGILRGLKGRMFECEPSE